MAFCPSCGRPVNASAVFCTACGASIATVAGQPADDAPAYTATAAIPSVAPVRPNVRPAGVTIIAVGLIVVAGLWIFGALAALFLLSVGAAWGLSFAQAWVPWLGTFGGLLDAFVTVALFAVVALGGLAIATGAGLLRGGDWAWGLTLGFMALNALSGLFSLGSRDFSGVVTILVSGIVIWYFFTPEVKAWFGRA